MAVSKGRRARDAHARVEWTGPRPLVSGVPVLIGAIVLGIAAAAILVTLGRRPGIPAELSAAYTNTMAGTLAPDIAVSEPQALATALRQAGTGFTPHIVSLLPDFRLQGGRVYEIDGRTAAAWIYQSPRMDQALALAFPATLDELGAPEDVRSDPPPPLRIFRKMTQTIVCWQERDIVHALVTTLPSERVIALARRLAGTPAASGHGPEASR